MAAFSLGLFAILYSLTSQRNFQPRETLQYSFRTLVSHQQQQQQQKTLILRSPLYDGKELWAEQIIAPV